MADMPTVRQTADGIRVGALSPLISGMAIRVGGRGIMPTAKKGRVAFCGYIRIVKKKHPLQCDDQSGLAGDHCGLMYGRIIFYLSCLTRMAWTWAIAAWRGVAFWIFKREIESKTFILSKDYGAEGEARAPWLVEQPPRAEKYQGCRATSD